MVFTGRTKKGFGSDQPDSGYNYHLTQSRNPH